MLDLNYRFFVRLLEERVTSCHAISTRLGVALAKTSTILVLCHRRQAVEIMDISALVPRRIYMALAIAAPTLRISGSLIVWGARIRSNLSAVSIFAYEFV